MKTKFLKIYFIISLLFCFSSCVDYEDPLPEISDTVLVYIAGENSLSSYATTNIEWMLEGIAKANLKESDRLLVYLDQKGATPQLLQIKQNKEGQAVKQIIKEYPEQNSASTEVMHQVLDDVFNDPKYRIIRKGLVLWSHATAWLPSDIAGVSAAPFSRSRAFGQDKKDWMEIDQLENVLKDFHFDYIIFDACYMANIEVAYALSNITDYLLAYPTEVLANGLPYYNIVQQLFGFHSVENSLMEIGDLFFDHYQKETVFGDQSANFSLVRSSELEKLAAISQEILSGREKNVYNIDINKLQRLDDLVLGYLPSAKHTLYDFNDFIKQLATDEQFSRFEEQLKKVVLYEKHTERAFYATQKSITIERLCGLSTYLPQKELRSLNDWYRKRVGWYSRVYK